MLNSALRSGDAAELKRLEPYIKVAESGLSQLPSFRGTVYRGTHLFDEDAAKYVPGKVVTEPHFTSTSLEMGEAFPGNTKFVINSQQGKEVSFLSEVPGEKEVLFMPSSQFEVLYAEIDEAGNRIIFMNEVARASK